MNDTSILQQGLSITFVGISVVFLSLIILLFFMKFYVFLIAKFQSQKKQHLKSADTSKISTDGVISGEIATAITLAIHQSRQDFHDLEKTIITFNRITRPYSPWSSKIHGIRKLAR